MWDLGQVTFHWFHIITGSTQFILLVLCHFCHQNTRKMAWYWWMHFFIHEKFHYVWEAALGVRYISSVAQSCPTLCDMDCSTPGLPVHHQLPEFTQTHVHWVGDAIQPTISSSVVPFSSRLNLSQHQGLYKWVGSSHQVAKVLEFQLQHKSFQRTPKTDLL